MIVPFGALPGFNLVAEKREVAAHYGVEWRALTKSDGRKSELIALARHALFWKLHKGRKLSTRRISQLLGNIPQKTIQQGVKLHEQRLAEFRATAGYIVRREKE